MYLPCAEGPGAKALMVEARRDMNRRKGEKDAVFNQAKKLQLTYPHLRSMKLKYLMWAIHRFTIKIITEIAASKLTPHLFKEAINQRNH